MKPEVVKTVGKLTVASVVETTPIL